MCDSCLNINCMLVRSFGPAWNTWAYCLWVLMKTASCWCSWRFIVYMVVIYICSIMQCNKRKHLVHLTCWGAPCVQLLMVPEAKCHTDGVPSLPQQSCYRLIRATEGLSSLTSLLCNWQKGMEDSLSLGKTHCYVFETYSFSAHPACYYLDKMSYLRFVSPGRYQWFVPMFAALTK